MDTCEYAILAIQRCLTQWRTKGDIQLYDDVYPQDLKTTLLSQHKLGWKAFQEGLVSTEWVKYQEAYYKEIGSTRAASLWASKFIRAIWELTWNTWDARNKQLHNTARINKLEGRDLLITAIQLEWNIGLGRLPASEFAHLLSGNLKSLLQSSLPALRRWLAVVRNGRILLDKQNIIDDEFMSDESLRKWVGIIKLQDGKPTFSSTSDG